MDLKEIAFRLREQKSVCVTGNPVMLRSGLEFADMLSACGLDVSSSVSKKLGVLIACSGSMQQKLDQAKALNIPIISEQQWFELMPELEAVGLWDGKPIQFADDNGIYYFESDDLNGVDANDMLEKDKDWRSHHG